MSKLTLWFNKNKPTILLACGITTAIGAVTTASIASYKLPNKVINPTKKKLVKLHKDLEITSSREGATQNDLAVIRKDINKLYVKTALRIAVYYTPSLLLLGTSIACNIGTHNILKSRNIALATAFAALKNSYDLYREKVANKIGKDAEESLFEEKEIVETTIKDSDGKEKIKKISTPSLNNDNITGLWWGPGNERYDSRVSNSLNMTQLLQIENYLNQTLRAKRYVFLSEVYERLGCSPELLGPTKLQAAQVLGWIYDPEDKTRDNYIDFGIHDKNGELNKRAKDFQCGIADFIWLNLNYDGDILTGDNGAKTYMKYAMGDK